MLERSSWEQVRLSRLVSTRIASPSPTPATTPLVGVQEHVKSSETKQQLDDVRRRARLNDLAPIASLRERGALSGRSLDELEREVMDLFELGSIDDEPTFAMAARRSNGEESLSPTQRAWVACVRKEARKRTPAGPFSLDALADLAKTLPTRMHDPESFEELPELLASVGVCLVYVEALPGAKMDGCTFFLDDVPVIGISGRGKRLDKILFTLLHEMAHLTFEHVTPTGLIVDSLDDGDDQDGDELAADQRAGEWVLPNGPPELPERVSQGWINENAGNLGVHPIVLIGRLQKDRRLPWRTTLVKDAPSVSAQLIEW